MGPQNAKDAQFIFDRDHIVSTLLYMDQQTRYTSQPDKGRLDCCIIQWIRRQVEFHSIAVAYAQFISKTLADVPC